MDAHKNFAYGTVLTAPSPATTGLTLDMVNAVGSLPTPPFNATVWPPNVIPTSTTAEIIRVTGIAAGGGVGGSDRVTFTRQAEGSTLRAIAVADQVSATITTKTLTDIEALAILGVAVAPSGRTFAALSGTNTNWSTPDAAAIDLATGVDVRAKVLLPSYTPAALSTIGSKWNTTGNQRSWQWLLKADGSLQFQFSFDGTSTTVTLTALATIPATIPTQFLQDKIWLRCLALGNDPANPSHSTMQNYYSIDDGVTWIPIGARSNSASFGTFFNSTASLFVGQTSNAANLLTGRVYRVQLYDGTLALKADFLPNNLANPPVAINNGSTGETWTPQASAARGLDEISNEDLRNWFMLPSKIQPSPVANNVIKTDTSGNVVWGSAPGGSVGVTEISGWDTTGTTDAAPLIQAAYDAGARYIRIVGAGTFYINTPIFFDADESTSSGREVILEGQTVTLKLGSGLPNVTEFDAFVTVNPGTKFAIFPSTLRTALTGGTVTAAGNFASPTRATTHPHFILRDIAVDGQNVAGCNVGVVFGNKGGATKLENVHLMNLRVGLSWTDYTDGNSVYSVSLIGLSGVTPPADAFILYQIQNGDAIVGDNCKVSQGYKLFYIYKNFGATLRATIGGGMVFDTCSGVVVSGDHQEMNIASWQEAYTVKDSEVTIIGGEAQPADGATSGMLYLNDSNAAGRSSQVEVVRWSPRRRLIGAAVDAAQSADIYLNQFSPRSVLRVCGVPNWSVAGGSVLNRYPRAFVIAGNATNLPGLAAAVALGRDVIGSGEFEIRWRNGVIEIANPGQVGGLKVTRQLGRPVIDSTDITAVGASGTLTNAQLYEYAIALAFTMPNGSVVYGQASLAVSATAVPTGAIAFHVQTPTAPGGCTIVVWRKTGTGVLTTPDHYIMMPWGFNESEIIDTGVNVNSLPWLTTSIPTPPSSDSTAPGVYVDGVAQ